MMVEGGRGIDEFPERSSDRILLKKFRRTPGLRLLLRHSPCDRIELRGRQDATTWTLPSGGQIHGNPAESFEGCTDKWVIEVRVNNCDGLHGGCILPFQFVGYPRDLAACYDDVDQKYYARSWCYFLKNGRRIIAFHHNVSNASTFSTSL